MDAAKEDCLPAIVGDLVGVEPHVLHETGQKLCANGTCQWPLGVWKQSDARCHCDGCQESVCSTGLTAAGVPWHAPFCLASAQLVKVPELCLTTTESVASLQAAVGAFTGAFVVGATVGAFVVGVQTLQVTLQVCFSLL